MKFGMLGGLLHVVGNLGALIFVSLFIHGLFKYKKAPLPKTDVDRTALVDNWKWAVLRAFS